MAGLVLEDIAARVPSEDNIDDDREDSEEEGGDLDVASACGLNRVYFAVDRSLGAWFFMLFIVHPQGVARIESFGRSRSKWGRR